MLVISLVLYNVLKRTVLGEKFRNLTPIHSQPITERQNQNNCDFRALIYRLCAFASHFDWFNMICLSNKLKTWFYSDWLKGDFLVTFL